MFIKLITIIIIIKSSILKIYLMTSLADDQGKNKLALLVLGAILGAGTFTVAKNFLSKQRNAVKKAEKESKQIKDDVLRSISGI